MNNFVLLILDGLGVGEASDVASTRPQDIGANTLKSIIKLCPQIKIPNLIRLGILDVLDYDSDIINHSALYSRIEFAHEGADTFMGHQEIMGTKPQAPIKHNFTKYLNPIKSALELENYSVRIVGDTEKYIIVDDCMIVSDNVECDLGSAINVTGPTDVVAFEKIYQISKIVRKIVPLPRVIAMGGDAITLDNLIGAIESPPGFIGVDGPKSSIFNKNYCCRHLGYGVNTEEQLPHILHKNNIKTYFVGKVADLVENAKGESHSIVPTGKVLNKLLEFVTTKSNSFLCANVQETDLSGHVQDALQYSKVLEEADRYIGEILEKLGDNDILVVTADHGNDPTIGHSKHTREYVPLLVSANNSKKGKFQQQNTLSCVAATVCDFYSIKYTSFGNSFLNMIF